MQFVSAWPLPDRLTRQGESADLVPPTSNNVFPQGECDYALLVIDEKGES